MKSEFKHNKKRNSGLLYEFLVRKMSEGVIDRDAKKYDAALAITKRYFSDGSPLCEERKFYDVLISSRGLDRDTASRLITDVRKQFSRLDQKRLDREKGSLIYELNTRFGKSFYDEYRLKNYREFATICMLMEAWKKNDVKSSPQRALLEVSVMDMVATDIIVEEKDVISDAVDDGLVYSVALKKLDERYGGSLNRRQKAVLREYVTFSLGGDAKRFARFMDEQRDILNEAMNSYDVSGKDTMFVERLSEVRERLAGYDFSDCGEDVVEEMMLYHTLVEEMTSDV